jgi:two-component system phosphate regulon sensor histidine kinase PhoR
MTYTIGFGIPLLAALVGVAAAYAGWTGFAIAWLAGWLALVALYHTIFLTRLGRWASLPRMREVPIGFGSWRRPLDRIARFMRLEAEERSEVADELAQLQTAVDRLPDGLMLLDRFNQVEWANITARDLHGVFGSRRPVHHFVNQPEFVAYLDAGEYTKPLRLGLPNRPGRTFEIRIHATDDQKQLLIIRDITDQALLDAMRSDFVANVSHEIRTPITVIGGFAETMLELELDADERRRHLESIVKQSRTMQRLVDDLLTLSTLESAIDKPADETIDLAPLCQALVADARVLSGGKHEIACRIPPGMRLLGVGAEIESAIRNLLSNAVRYTPAGGRVSLDWSERDGMGALTVADTGIGIPAVHLPRLTERFYRVDRARSRLTGGTGLGLAIVKHIAHRHGAELVIESRAGEGSRFTLRFPPMRVIRPDFVPSEPSEPTAG